MEGRFVSLRARLLVLLVLVLVPWLALVLYTQAEERSAAIVHVHRDETRLIRLVTSNQAAEIEAARQLLIAFARLPQVRMSDASACSAFMKEMLGAYPAYQNLGVISPDGNVWCSGVQLVSMINVADRMYFQRAIAARDFAIGDYQIGRITLVPQVNYAYPLLGDGDRLQGIVYAAQSLNWLTLALANSDFPPGAIFSVVDRNGTVLARLPDAGDLIGKTLPEPEVLTALTGRKEGGVFEADDAHGVRRLWAFAPLIAGHDLHAAIGVPKAIAFADSDRRLARNLAALGVVTLAGFAAAWFGSRFILRQVDALVAATQRVAAGHLGARATAA